jgi:hypothetical protein
LCDDLLVDKPGRQNWTSTEAVQLARLARVGITKVEAARRLGRHRRRFTARPESRAYLHATAEAQPAPRLWTAPEDELLRELSVQGGPLYHAANQLDRDYFTTWRARTPARLTWRRDTQARPRLQEYLSRNQTDGSFWANELLRARLAGR